MRRRAARRLALAPTGAIQVVSVPAALPRRLLASRIGDQPLLLVVGVGAWAFGLSEINRSAIGSYGLLASASAPFLLGLIALLAGFLIELLRREPRGWLLGLHIVALVVAIHATVPILFGTPEYSWVYKHIGVTQQLGISGRVTDSNSIYQLWPALFAAAASLASLGHVGPLTFATWAPLAFELADALVLLAIFRLLTRERRVAWLALLLYEAVISWVGQDYFSPQAFSYLLWLGIVLIVLRWLRAPPPVPGATGRLARLRAPLLVQLDPPAQPARRLRVVAVIVLATVYFAIVAAHQLTPYIALTGIGALTVLDLVRPRWLLVLMAVIAGAYLVPRYSLIAHDFGGLFSGSNPIQNASGSRGTHHAGAEAMTATIVRGLAALMWLGALAALRRWRKLFGRVAIPAALAFSPFLILVFQSYGGEAIYRIFLFSAPWCVLLIAWMLHELRLRWLRWAVIGSVSAVALFAGLQGLFGPVAQHAFTPAELAASRWLPSHTPRGSLIVLPDEDFPALATAGYAGYDVEDIPADPQLGNVLVDESSLAGVESWIEQFGQPHVYVVVSRGMRAYADYFGWPRGYGQLAAAIQAAPEWRVVYRNSGAAIYRLDLTATTSAPVRQQSTSSATRGAARPRVARRPALRSHGR